MSTSTLELLPEEGLEPGFAAQVASYPGGEKIRRCIQCGTCSGSCQMSADMDYTPRRILAMVRAGMKKEVLSSQAIWYCAACYYCTARCPMGIKLTEVMFALKSLALKEGYVSLKQHSPAFYKSFYEVVERYGRMHEASLIIGLALKTNPLDFVGLAPFGLNMFRKGKIEILPHGVKNRQEIKALVQLVQRLEVR